MCFKHVLPKAAQLEVQISYDYFTSYVEIHHPIGTYYDGEPERIEKEEGKKPAPYKIRILNLSVFRLIGWRSTVSSSTVAQVKKMDTVRYGSK